MSRNPHKPTPATRKLVKKVAGHGIPHETIAILVGVKDDKTLRKWYRKELDEGRAVAHSKIGGKAFQRAMKGSDTMLIWYTKTQMRWKEERSLELSGPGGAPIALESNAEPELLGAYIERQARIAAERRANSGSDQTVGGDGPELQKPESSQDPSEV